MVQFTQWAGSAVYLASSNQAASGGWAFVLTVNPQGTPSDKLPPGPFSLDAALSWQDDAWVGNLVYVAAETEAIAADSAGFAASIAIIRADSYNGPCALIFLPTPTTATGGGAAVQGLINAGTIYVVILSNAGGQITPLNFFNVTLTGAPGVTAQFSSNVSLSVSDGSGPASILFAPFDSSASPAIVLGGPVNPQQAVPRSNTASLYFEGSACGAFGFDVAIDEVSLTRDLNMGFQLLIPNLSGAPNQTLSAYLPLEDPGADDGTAVEFDAEVNILNPNNTVDGAAATRFLFTGSNKLGATETPTVLASNYRTAFGKAVTLVPVTGGASGQPASLVVDPGQQETVLQNGFRFAPAGDFVLSVDGAAAAIPQALLCGQSGTETVAFLPEIAGVQDGERIRFVSGQPANAPQFPLLPVSPVGPPLDPKATLLDASFRTSWASFVAPPTDAARRALYAAAPKGAELFGLTEQSDVSGLLGPQNPGVALPAAGGVVFPLLPLAGLTAGTGQQDITPEQFELLNRQIIGPVRKAAIDAGVSSGAATLSASAARSLLPASAAAANSDALTSTTTPTGFITRYDTATGEWKQLLLGQVTSGGAVTVQMGFTDLAAELQAAFQTNDQFLVIANNAKLGPFTLDANGQSGPSVFMPPADADIVDQRYFFNRVDIGQWRFAAEPGANNQYGDYRSVIIVKGLKGRILDIDQAGAVTAASLLRSPDKWTMRDVFASPDPPDMSELVPLSTWLVDYCADAYSQRSDPYFAKFAAIITDPEWTGVLILKAAIAEVPPDVVGILAGVKDPANFFAHHIGIDIGQIDKNKVEQTGTTSMFGLVHYIDPRYDDGLPPHTIAPLDLEAPQDFSLLTLKALFENSAVRKFDSLAQMVLNRLFGSAVTSMVDVKPEGRSPNVNNAVLLEGGIQKNGDAVVYSLASKWPNQYFLANNVLGNVEIDTAVMSTRDDGSKSGEIVSWIGIGGFLNFLVVPPVPDPDGGAGLPAFDIFSYGPEPGDDDALRQGLAFANLGLSISTRAEAAGEESAATPTLSLVEREITFNSASSHAREQSLFRSFQLELLGLLSGDASGASGATKSDPASLGYLPVVTQYNLRSMPAGWHGLCFKLDLGTPGALAGKVKLDSSLLLAWADDSGAANADTRLATVAIQLPGAGGGGELFSLQTVIKLSIGLIQLMYTAPDPATENPGGFLLVLNEIALKLLGLLKIPPSGNTAFLLFGDPDAAEATGLGWFAVYNKAKESQA